MGVLDLFAVIDLGEAAVVISALATLIGVGYMARPNREGRVAETLEIAVTRALERADRAEAGERVALRACELWEERNHELERRLARCEGRG